MRTNVALCFMGNKGTFVWSVSEWTKTRLSTVRKKCDIKSNWKHCMACIISNIGTWIWGRIWGQSLHMNRFAQRYLDTNKWSNEVISRLLIHRLRFKQLLSGFEQSALCSIWNFSTLKASVAYIIPLSCEFGVESVNRSVEQHKQSSVTINKASMLKTRQNRTLVSAFQSKPSDCSKMTHMIVSLSATAMVTVWLKWK